VFKHSIQGKVQATFGAPLGFSSGVDGKELP